MKKIGLLCMALVLALGMLGVGYATWTDTVYIDGTVNMGTVGIELSEDTASDDEAPEKDVSSITCVVDGDTLFVTVTNAYPCITYTNTFDVHCTGSVPVILKTDWNMANVPAGATITVSGIDGEQIHYCDAVWGTITVHIDNTVAQGSSFTFSCTITGTQYNMA